MMIVTPPFRALYAIELPLEGISSESPAWAEFERRFWERFDYKPKD
jgi:hypothetical protein